MHFLKYSKIILQS